MTTVFLGGSRHASLLNAEIRRRLDNIIERGFPVVVGDANGADKAMQQYLHDRHYTHVEVFCSNGVCRNNIGGWRTQSVPARTREGTAQFYSAKDRAMAQQATVGLMVWDGKSVGTLLNAFRLLTLQKTVVIYSIPDRQFTDLRTSQDWQKFISSRDIVLRRKVEQRAKTEAPEGRALGSPLFG